LSIISYKLDLVITLVDATTGRDVTERDIFFYRDGERLMPARRGASTFILMNYGREDFDLVTEVRGFHPVRTPIRYERMDEREPLAIVFLIPDGNALKNTDICEVTGRIPKLSAIEAIGLSSQRCCINLYNARRQEMSVFQTEGGGDLEDVHYGILHAQEDTFEHIEVGKSTAPNVFKLRYPLEQPFDVNAPICRIVFGNVEKDGSYRIAMRRVSPDGTPAILRYQKNGDWYYLKCDFNELTDKMILKAKKFETPNDREEVDTT
jgi:hypothetical protein